MSDYGKSTKSQLLEVIQALEAQIATLEAEVSQYRPSPSGKKLDMNKAQMIRDLWTKGTSKNALSIQFRVSRDTINAVLANQIYKVQIELPKTQVIETPKAKIVKKASDAQIHTQARKQAEEVIKARKARKATAQRMKETLVAKEAEVAQVTNEVKNT